MNSSLIEKMSFNRTICFSRLSQIPFIGTKENSFYQESATTADILEYKNKTLLFFGGVKNNHESIGLAQISQANNGIKVFDIKNTPIVEPSEKKSFDNNHVTDPAAVYSNGKIYLYYSGIGAYEDAIGLSVSVDGKHFEKVNENPIVNGRAPEVVFCKGIFYLFYVLPVNKGGYDIYLAFSDDGIHFTEKSKKPILSSSSNSWDSKTVTTPRILSLNGFFYMIYAGDNVSKDLPRGFGLAVSKNLIEWEKYPHNPIFVKGEVGSWDDSAIWFGTPFIMNEELFMLYEGCTKNKMGQYESQIGLAKLTNFRVGL